MPVSHNWNNLEERQFKQIMTVQILFAVHVIMNARSSQISSLTIVYLTVYSRRRWKKTSKLASLAFVWGIHRWPVYSPHRRPVTRKIFPFDDVTMCFQETCHCCYNIYHRKSFEYFVTGYFQLLVLPFSEVTPKKRCIHEIIICLRSFDHHNINKSNWSGDKLKHFFFHEYQSELVHSWWVCCNYKNKINTL